MAKNLIIIALLTLNGVFAWYLYRHALERTATASIGDTQSDVVNLAQALPGTTSSNERSKTKDSLARIDHTTSYLDLATTLRREELDETLVRQIVFAQIKRDQLDASIGIETPYWQADYGQGDEEETEARLRAEADQRLALINVFGEDIVDDPLFVDLFKPLNDRVPFLSSEKQIAIDEERRRMFSGRDWSSVALEENREEFLQARQNFETGLAQIMTPDELFEYNLRESRLARLMRRRTADFDYSEQEFRELYRLRSEVYGEIDPGNRKEFREQRELAEQRSRDYLGNERYQELERARDGTYRVLKAIGERYGNSENEIIAMYNETSEARNEIDALSQDESLEPGERRARRQEIWQAAMERIEDIGGEDTAESIQSNERRLGVSGAGPWRFGR